MLASPLSPADSNFANSAPADSSPAVAVLRLMVSHFRNYETLELDLPSRSGSVVLLGANGGGKTNLLEAISFLAPGRGLRRAKSDMLTRNSSMFGDSKKPWAIKPWAISADIMTENGAVKVGTGTAEDAPRNRRLIKINGALSSQSALAEHVAVSWLTPDMDGILASSPSDRRRFLDRLVMAFDPVHVGRLQRYEKAYRQRSRLFEDGSGDSSWFDSLEALLAETGVAIVAARRAMVDALNLESAKPLPVFPSAHLYLDGEVETWLASMPALAAEDRIKEQSRDNRRLGLSSLPGPMSSLLRAVHSRTGLDAELSSTGEQKALVISVVLSHARLQSRRLRNPPLLLLDDVASHLDFDHRGALFDLTSDLMGQVWFSGTDAAAFSGMASSPSIFEVSDGVLRCWRSRSIAVHGIRKV